MRLNPHRIRRKSDEEYICIFCSSDTQKIDLNVGDIAKQNLGKNQKLFEINITSSTKWKNTYEEKIN